MKFAKENLTIYSRKATLFKMYPKHIELMGLFIY